MARGTIIPSRPISSGSINSSAIAPVNSINGEMNDQKVVIDNSYDGSETYTARITVDNENHIIYADVFRVPYALEITKEGEQSVVFDGSSYKKITLDAYTLNEVQAKTNELKRYELIKNGTKVGDTIIIPKDVDLQQALNDEVAARISADEELATILSNKEDKVECEVTTKSILDGFVFENNKEVTCDDNVTDNITLTVNDGIEQGFISLLTIMYMSTQKTITIVNQSDYVLRIVNEMTVKSGDTFTTKYSGKKIIFARCDGVNIEILIIEEIE